MTEQTNRHDGTTEHDNPLVIAGCDRQSPQPISHPRPDRGSEKSTWPRGQMPYKLQLKPAMTCEKRRSHQSRAGPERKTTKRMTVGTRYAGLPVTLIKIVLILGDNGLSNRAHDRSRPPD